jgi:hypothetical protein
MEQVKETKVDRDPMYDALSDKEYVEMMEREKKSKKIREERKLNDIWVKVYGRKNRLLGERWVQRNDLSSLHLELDDKFGEDRYDFNLEIWHGWTKFTVEKNTNSEKAHRFNILSTEHYNW